MASPLPFEPPIRTILVWAGEEEATGTYGGETVRLPPRDVAVEAGKGAYRFGSVRDRDGRLMPGTIVLEDQYRVDPSNAATYHTFKSREWVKGLYGVNRKLFERGLTVVYQPEDVAAAMEAGIPMWRRAKLQEWEEEVRTEMERRQRWENKGQPAPPLDGKGEESLKRAIQGLRSEQSRLRSAISDADLLTALGQKSDPEHKQIDPLESVAQPPEQAHKERKRRAKPAPAAETPSDDEDLKAVAAERFRLARSSGVDLSKEEMEGLYAADPKAILVVDQKLEAAGVTEV